MMNYVHELKNKSLNEFIIIIPVAFVYRLQTQNINYL